MMVRDQAGERPHHLHVRACAMQQHDGRKGRIAPPQIDHIQSGARDIDPHPPRWISPIKDKNANLRQQGQRDHDHDK
jgi:hypothetical protein